MTPDPGGLIGGGTVGADTLGAGLGADLGKSVPQFAIAAAAIAPTAVMTATHTAVLPCAMTLPHAGCLTRQRCRRPAADQHAMSEVVFGKLLNPVNARRLAHADLHPFGTMPVQGPVWTPGDCIDASAGSARRTRCRRCRTFSPMTLVGLLALSLLRRYRFVGR